MLRTIAVSGGGIGGLSTAIALSKIPGVERVTVLEKNPSGPRRAAPASGIALWRNSLQVYSELGLLDALESVGAYMQENIAYYDQNGTPLARAPASFHQQFPILCLQREDLQSVLVDHLEQQCQERVEFVNGASCESFVQGDDHVRIHLASGDQMKADLLVGADGLHSGIRESVCPTPVQYCGYTYYRATLDASQLEGRIQGRLEDYSSHSFESWGVGKRFGFVPLRAPALFWFASIPAPPLDETSGYTTQAITEEDKRVLEEHFQSFKSPLEIGSIMQATRTDQILRTDIHKVPVLSTWSSGRVVLLGDAAHATSPNLAQGAGLSIEDAIQLAANIRQVNQEQLPLSLALQAYQQARKPRAEIVQSVADAIAAVGQATGVAASTRNWVMSTGTQWTPGLQQFLFQKAVEYSLSWQWRLPLVRSSCLWERVMGPAQFGALPPLVQRFRQAQSNSGTGRCTVEYYSVRGRWAGRLLQFPRPMEDSPFVASVRTLESGEQEWKRVFGYQTEKELAFHTYMDLDATGQGLMETKWTSQFHYEVQCGSLSRGEGPEALQISYRTREFYLLPGVKWWRWLSPHSEWTETPTRDGWLFDGFISLPLVGKVFRYYGRFHVQDSSSSPHEL